MRPGETVLGMGRGEIKENGGGMNSAKIYYKNVYKCHNIPILQ
jgi:hypothetical protein